ncbi:Uncharacterised protein [Serratia fonticola]|uniref:Uncharacterized protein n=1 Tax=Serratia fonticola TaxID=47917 RepID=A0A4U9TPG2_SERFO|nr:Uncharacterised protein [Serratia fonticola]
MTGWRKTLQRFSQRREALKDKARVNQRRIDEMFNTLRPRRRSDRVAHRH